MIAKAAVQDFCIVQEQSPVIAAPLAGMNQFMGNGLLAGMFGSLQQTDRKFNRVSAVFEDTLSATLFGTSVDKYMGLYMV